MQLLQSYDIQFNNIMNPGIEYPSNSNSKAKEVEEEEIPPQGHQPMNLK